MGRGSSGSSCIAILNWNLSHNFCGSVIQAWLSSLLFRISQGCSSLDLQSNVRLLSSVFIGRIPFLPSEYWSPWILEAALSFLTGISNGIPFNMELCFQSSIKVSSKLVKFKGLHGVYMQIWGTVPFSGYYPYHFSSSTRPKLYSLFELEDYDFSVLMDLPSGQTQRKMNLTQWTSLLSRTNTFPISASFWLLFQYLWIVVFCPKFVIIICRRIIYNSAKGESCLCF